MLRRQDLSLPDFIPIFGFLQQQLNLELSPCMSMALTTNTASCTRIAREMPQSRPLKGSVEVVCLSWVPGSGKLLLSMNGISVSRAYV